MVLAEAFRQVGMAIAASKRLGWIALGLYIMRMNAVVIEENPFYDSIIEYHRAMGSGYQFIELAMGWADDHRMAMFPEELSMRIEVIDNNWGHIVKKQQQKAMLIRRTKRAQNELFSSWSN